MTDAVCNRALRLAALAAAALLAIPPSAASARPSAISSASRPSAVLAADATAPLIDYVKPVPGPIVRHFEPPATPYGPGHRGIDIATPVGTIVIAAAAGTVHFAGAVGGQLYVSIDHADGVRTTYSFLSAVLVRAGARVRQGDAIARSGPGHPGQEPAHLHFGAISGESYLDPELLLVRSLRRNLWWVIHLAPEAEPSPSALPQPSG